MPGGARTVGEDWEEGCDSDDLRTGSISLYLSPLGVKLLFFSCCFVLIPFLLTASIFNSRKFRQNTATVDFLFVGRNFASTK